MKKTGALLLIGFAAGCLASFVVLSRFQIVAVGGESTRAFRLDRWTGEVIAINPMGYPMP